MAGEHFSQFVEAAVAAFDSDPDDGALIGTGFLEVVAGDMTDPDEVDAVYATLLAEGRRLGRSSAMFRLMAHPYRLVLGDSIPAIVGVSLDLDGSPGAVVPSGWSGPVLVERPEGPVIIDTTRLRCHETPTIDPDFASIVTFDLPGVVLDADASRSARSAELGSLAVAFELLGACEALLELGTRHALDRQQFGKPIASFQAVRHLLAWASLDTRAGHALCAAASGIGGAPTPGLADVARLSVLRSALRVSNRVAQVLGGVGFTWEHDFHRYHRRILLVSTLMGPEAAATSELGAAVLGGFDPASALPLLSQLGDDGTSS